MIPQRLSLTPCAELPHAFPYHMPHQSEFLSLWASLTTGKGPNAPEGKASIRATVRQASEDVDTELDDIQHIRPCYDIVEEYCRSLELYRDKAQPSDERLSYVVMQVCETDAVAISRDML